MSLPLEALGEFVEPIKRAAFAEYAEAIKMRALADNADAIKKEEPCSGENR
jgi:hypothetical protein